MGLPTFCRRRKKMASNKIFSNCNSNVPTADCTNEAGGKAYKMSDKSALAQYACTGVFNGTFYASDREQFDRVLELAKGVDSKFIGQLALYSRKVSFMKDMPSFLLAVLAGRKDTESTMILKSIFSEVIDNGKMLRNFVQIVRSGACGRKSFGTVIKKLINNWFRLNSANYIYTNSIGNDPSIADVIKMVHPRPRDAEYEALFGYFLGKEVKFDNLPSLVKEYEAFKKNPTVDNVPNIPFQFIASLDIPEDVWKEIAKNGGWHMVRMNLNTFSRHGVFKDSKMVDIVADKLRNAELIRKSKVFPYQILTAYKSAVGVPSKIYLALQDALEISLENIPSFGENVYIAIDVSGSMTSPVTGYNGSATTATTCIDVAALFASAVLRTTPTAEVLPYDNRVRNCVLNPRDSVMTNSQKLAFLCGGATNCSAPLEKIIAIGKKVDTIIFISDCESWMDSGSGRYSWRGNGTSAMGLFSKIKRKNKNAKCICIDIQPYGTTQLKDNDSILNIGGFNDKVFNVISSFCEGSKSHWVDEIEKMEVL